MMLRAEVFSPSGRLIGSKVVDRPTPEEGEDAIWEWFVMNFDAPGTGCAVDWITPDGELVEQLHDWCV